MGAFLYMAFIEVHHVTTEESAAVVEFRAELQEVVITDPAAKVSEPTAGNSGIGNAGFDGMESTRDTQVVTDDSSDGDVSISKL